MPRQLLGHFESKDRPFDSVIKDVETDQAGVQVVILKAGIVIGFRYRHSRARLSVSGTRIRLSLIHISLLHGLEKKGYVRSVEKRNGQSIRKVYRATPLGRKALKAMKVKVSELFGELTETR